MKRSPLSRVESLLRRVVEEPFTWLAGDPLDPFRLATHLVRHYEERTADGLLPNHFTLAVSPADYAEMTANGLPELEAQVAEYVALLAERRGLHPTEPARVTFAADDAAPRRQARAVASHEIEQADSHTDVYTVNASDAIQAAIRAADAFLIVQGRQHIALDRPVTRIGRRMDNDIVLDAPSISRQHAQIRWRQPYFVLYDVSRHAQTAVNGAPVREHVLRPGDVIALSDVMLVYGEGRDEPVAHLSALSDDEWDTTMQKPYE
jgi:hypothetical protein